MLIYIGNLDGINMLIPTKYENLSKNIIVLGSDVVLLLKKNNYTLEDLFAKLKSLKDVNLDLFYDVITFLWLVEIIKLDDYYIKLSKRE